NPQVSYFTGSVFCDTVNWQHVTASFIASGGENTITIGCFKKDEDVLTQTLNSYWKFGTGFYIDAIALYPCDAPVFEADAGADTTICLGQGVTLGTHSLPQYSYLWLSENGDTLSTEAFIQVQPTHSTTYTLQVTDFKFDITTDHVTLSVDECNFPLYVPNIFSPNGDGNNDQLCVRGQQISSLKTFRVFNRWGEEVFGCHTDQSLGTAPDQCCWNGTFRGQQAPTGVYTWYAEAIMISGQIVTGHGNVTLVR
ncbi:MAG: gliding motility-associated C-terminal domain-containing protein, partial [Candidatus Riflebacteria bacterium]